MSGQRKIWLLIALMAGACFIVNTVSLGILYRTAVQEERERLKGTARSQARLIEAVAHFDTKYYPRHRGGPSQATLSQVIEAHKKYKGIARTDEFVLARREGDHIVFLLRHRLGSFKKTRPVPFASALAEPMRRALQGQSGTMIGLDYRGVTVLAAYEPVDLLHLGIVAKVDMAEVRKPFLVAGLFTTLIALLLSLVGAHIFHRVGTPIVRELEESEERYRTLFARIPCGVAVTSLSGEMLACNEALCQILGYPPQEIDKIPVPQHYAHPEERQQILSLLQEQGELYNYEITLRRKDGTLCDASLQMIPFRFQEENALLSAVEDISQLKANERAREELQAQLQQQQKLEAIGTLASGVAHEINNPINSIMNYAQLIVDRLQGEASLKNFAQQIINESERIAVIVRNLLTFSRYEEEQTSPASLNDIVEKTLSLLRANLRKHKISLHVEIPPELPSIRCRFQQIQQVLMNLLTNARDALNQRYPGSHKNKQIRLTVQRLGPAQGKEQTKEQREEGEWLRLTVEDRGGGIPPPLQEKIFEPFFTTKPKNKGTGLGLAVSYGIVQEHKGRLLVESEEDHLTRFHLDLPLPSR